MSDSNCVTSKVCKDCGEEKPASEFSRNKSHKDGLQSYCKPCEAARSAEYRATHKEEIAARNAEYRKARNKAYADVVVPETKVCRDCGEEKPASEFYANKENKDGLGPYCKPCNAARGSAYHAAHRERIATRKAEWREANPGYFRGRYAANRERQLALNRERVKDNPERNAAKARNRRALKRTAPGSHTAEDVQAQYDRQKGHCKWCDCKVGDDYHVDHVVPLSEGGSNWPSNLVIACPTCNLSKHAKHPMDWAGVLF